MSMPRRAGPRASVSETAFRSNREEPIVAEHVVRIGIYFLILGFLAEAAAFADSHPDKKGHHPGKETLKEKHHP